MESARELKPCPFCGSPAEMVNIDSTDEHEPNCGGSYIFCPSCLTSSKVVFGEKIGLEEAWNMRTTHDRVLEACETAIRKECADREAQLLDAAKAFQELATCYRIGKRPTEKLFARLEKANAAIEGADHD